MSAAPTRRRFLRLASAGALALALAGTSATALAAEATVNAVLGSAQVEVGQAVYLQVEVATDGGRIGEPKFSGVDGLDIISRGTSSGMSIEIANGRRVQRSTKTFTYLVSPREAGEYAIGVEVEVDGVAHRPERKPKLSATGEALEPQVEAGKAGDTPQDPSAEVIVWPVVDKATAYVGEQIVYELQIWERRNLQIEISSAPTFKDFWSENLSDERRRRPRAERGYVDAVPDAVHKSIVRALFPQKAGTLTIGGPEVQAQQVMGLFGGGGPPRTYVGRTLAIEVQPLPAAGQPPGFRPNNVGKFTTAAEVDRPALKQGEAVRLSIRIAGIGNIALVELPELPDMPGLRAYEPKPQTPQISTTEGELRGSRVYTMLLVAEDAGELTIPAIELPYFDPKTERYALAKTKPITLTVEANPDAARGQPEDGGAPAQAGDTNDDDDELLAPPIAGGELPRTTPSPSWLTRERWWTGTLAAPGLIGLGWVASKLARRYAPDEQRRARMRELARRKTLLAEAAAVVESGEGFYPKLASLLQAAAIGRAGNDGVGLTRERLIRLLAERGVADEELATLRELLDECDAARFGAGSGDVDQRRAHLDRARKLLEQRSWEPT